MGRVKTTLIKRTTRKLLRLHGEELKKSFEENKKALSELAVISSKKLRNSIAGYATRLKKKEKE